MCQRCAECCKNIPYVELSDNEIRAIEVFTGQPAKAFINTKGPKIPGYFLKYKDNGDCIFLMNLNGNYACEIYSVRPNICKSYPVTQGQIKFCRAQNAKKDN